MMPTRPRLVSRALYPSLAALLLLAGCATVPAPEPASRPRLVVLLVVDGLPQRQVAGFRDQLAPDGLNRFLERGAWFADAHYGHAHTVTAAGHAAMLTGAYPHRTGIISNDWRDPASGKAQYNTADAAHAYLGHKTGAFVGTSPKNLRVETLGDVLRGVDANSKVVAISGKDRGAILPAGHKGTAYMYMAQTGQFASSTYYMKEHPAWVARFNEAKPADRYFKATWAPLLPEMAYARSVPDGQPWMGKGAKLPMAMGEGFDAPGPLYYDRLYRSPFLDALSLDFARAAIEGEGLGRDDSPDILAVSLSSHDYINHAFGSESRLSHDHVLQLDLLFQGFFRDLDRRVGPDNYLVVLTADHGFTPAPGYLKTNGLPGGMLSGSQSLARLERRPRGAPRRGYLGARVDRPRRGARSRPHRAQGPRQAARRPAGQGAAAEGRRPRRRVHPRRDRGPGDARAPVPRPGAQDLASRALRRPAGRPARQLDVLVLLVLRGDARLAPSLRHERAHPRLRAAVGEGRPHRRARGGRGHRAHARAHPRRSRARRERGEAAAAHP